MQTFTDLRAFEDFCAAHGYEVEPPIGTAGYAVAYNYRGVARARCFVTQA